MTTFAPAPQTVAPLDDKPDVMTFNGNELIARKYADHVEIARIDSTVTYTPGTSGGLSLSAIRTTVERLPLPEKDNARDAVLAGGYVPTTLWRDHTHGGGAVLATATVRRAA
jgi:hypothetical protein